MLKETFLRAIICRARQAGKIDQYRRFIQLGRADLWRWVQIEIHFRARDFGLVGKLQQLSPKRSNGGFRCYGHDFFGECTALDSVCRMELISTLTHIFCISVTPEWV